MSYTSSGGAAALKVAQPYAQNVINGFNLIGTAPATTTTSAPTKGHKSTATTTTTVPTEAHSLVGVDVLNASVGERPGAHDRRRAHEPGLPRQRDRRCLDAAARGQLFGDPLRAVGHGGRAHAGVGAERAGHPGGRSQPQQLDGPALDRRVAVDRGRLVRNDHHHHDDDVADRAGRGATTTTTIPSDVYANTQPEPWNPSPCSLGQPTTTTSTRTTKQAVTKK